MSVGRRRQFLKLSAIVIGSPRSCSATQHDVEFFNTVLVLQPKVEKNECALQNKIAQLESENVKLRIWCENLQREEKEAKDLLANADKTHEESEKRVDLWFVEVRIMMSWFIHAVSTHSVVQHGVQTSTSELTARRHCENSHISEDLDGDIFIVESMYIAMLA